MSRSYVLNLVPVKRRARFNRHTGRSYTPEQTVAEEQAVRDAYKGLWFPEDVPLAVRIDVYRALPKDRPRRIESEPDIITPDVDNIAKAVLDGLQDKTAQDGRVVQRGAYANDKQVVALTIVKHDRIRKAGDSIRFSVEEAREYDRR